jgi:Protein of unknown function (DUF3617)
MKLFLALALSAGAIAWAADPVPLNVKTGQWETTVTTQMTGMPQSAQQMPTIPPEQLAQMPPEQRAKIEAALKRAGAMASGKPTSTTSKNCIKKEDLTKFNPNADANKDRSCKTTLVSSSLTKQELKMDCESNGNKQTGTVVVEALSSESTKFSVQFAANQDGHAMNMTINGTSKWLGETCSDAK